MKKHIIAIPILILCIVFLVILVNLPDRDDDEKKQIDGDINLYYISMDGLSLHEVPYRFKISGDAADLAEEALEQLRLAPENEKCQPTIPGETVWTGTMLDGTNFIIDFTASYSKMNNAQEIFLRAGIVKTLVQIDGIATVEFKIGGMPLMAVGDQPVGMMNADRFIDDADDNWGVNQQETMRLFFANETGDKLVEKKTAITVVNNIPLEQLMIEALMDESQEELGCYCPIPEGTKVLKTVTKDEVCYVDLSKEFLNPMENVSAEISVYAIVNSLVEKENINKVQFTVEGEKISTFRETLNLEAAFDRNLDLVEAEKTNQELEIIE